jgi:DNA-binding NtrC family response regulator
LLEKAGYVVLEAEDSRAALALAKAHEGPIHLVVTDLGMPGMGGAALVQAIRCARAEVKAIFISGYGDGASFDDMTLEEGVNFLQKPFPPHALDSMVRATLDGISTRRDS